MKEEIFKTDSCRSPIAQFDFFQLEEVKNHIKKVIYLQNNLSQN